MRSGAPPGELRGFVPRLLLQRLAAGDRAPAPLDGAVLFADISGFTRLTRSLTGADPAGVEKLAAVLDAGFSPLIDAALAHGGDVLKFAGDGLLVLFPAEGEGGTAEAVARAASCALDSLARVDGLDGGDGNVLRLSIGIGAGRMRMMQLPGLGARSEFLVAGAPIVQATDAQNDCGVGEARVSPEAAALLPTGASVQPGGDRASRLAAAPRRSAAEVAAPEVDAETLAPFVPQVVQRRLSAGHAEFLAELRPVSVLFVRIAGLDPQRDDVHEQADSVLVAAQTALQHYGGGLDKLVLGDKGLTVLAVFGLPPESHEDDAARAVLAAREIAENLDAIGLRCSVGVATGRAFCGASGDARRREYTTLGDVVNLSARLMQAADGRVLVDAPTRAAAASRFEFDALPSIRVKGFEHPVDVWTPSTATSTRLRRRPAGELVGRSEELRRLEARLDRLERGAEGGVVVLEGEAGIGKSVLLGRLIDLASARRVPVLGGAGDAIQASTAYFAWRTALSRLLSGRLSPSAGDDPFAETDGGAYGPIDEAERRRQLVRDLLGDSERLSAWAPLLNDVLPLQLPANETTAQMTGQARADSLRDLVVHLLRHATGRAPHLLVVDDAHWLDSASWGLLVAVARRVPRLLIVVGTRPLRDVRPPEYDALLELPGCEHIELGSLRPEDAVALVARRLGVAELPAKVAELIIDRAEGHPLFSEELAFALRDSGVLRIEDGRATPAGDLRAMSFPDTVQGVIGSRMDQLSPQEQLAMKVASVIGRIFGYRLLRDIHPVEEDRGGLHEHLTALVAADLARVETPDPDLSHIFKHIVVQDVAYERMVPSQRRRLHEAVARWYERAFRDDLSPYLPLLAHHYGRAGKEDEALAYLERAGDQAIERFANDEAIRFFEEALRRDAEAGGTDRLRRARWRLGIGTALRRQGRWAELLPLSRLLLADLGRREEHGAGVRLLRLLTAVAVQAVHLLLPTLFVGRASGRRREVARLASSTYQGLAEYYYREGRGLEMMQVSMEGINLADRCGDGVERASACGTAGVQAGLFGLTGLSERYHRQALEISRRIDHLPTVAMTRSLALATGVATGRWDFADRAYAVTDELTVRLGDRYQWELNQALHGFERLHQGRWAESDRILGGLWESSHPHGSIQNQALACLGRLASDLQRDAVRREDLERLQAVMDLGIPATDAVLAHGLLALAWYHLDEPDQALADAAIAKELIRRTPPATYYRMTGLSSLAQLFLELAEAPPPGLGKKRGELLAEAAFASKALSTLAMLNAVVRPRALAIRAWVDAARGRTRAARRRLDRALAAARTLEMEHEVGVMQLMLAELEPESSPRRAALLAEGEARVREAGALAALRRTGPRAPVARAGA